MGIKRVRIKHWVELEESCHRVVNGDSLEFESDTGNLLFLDEMREFCGEEFEVEVDEDGSFRYGGFRFVPDMYEVIENNLAFDTSKPPKITLKIQYYNRDKEPSVEYCMRVDLEEVLDTISKRDSFHQTMEIFGIPAKIFIEFNCE